MPMYNKKSYLLFILLILKKYTDEDHPMLQKEILDKIKQIYGWELDRKSIASSIETINEFDEFCIEKIPNKGYYYAGRDLDVTQVQYLIDAIYSSKSITGKQAEELVNTLTKEFLSTHQRKNYNYVYKSTEVNRSINKDFFYNIDVINKAIEHKKMISFQYIEYDKSGKQVLVFNGWRRKVSPYYLINNFGKYYLLAHYYKYKDNASTYRIDYMVNVQEEEYDAYPIEQVKDLGKNFKIYDYINEHVYMFNSEVIEATLLIENKNAIRDTIDWFGTSAKIFTKEEATYAKVKCNKLALVFWALQYIQMVKIVEPASLQQEVITLLEEQLAKYKALVK